MNDERRRRGLVAQLAGQERTRDVGGVRAAETDEAAHGELVGLVAAIVENQARVGGQQHRDFDLVADRDAETIRHRDAEQHASVSVCEQAARGQAVGMEGRARLVAQRP